MKINIKNTDKLYEAIRNAEGRATQRTITTDQIISTLEHINVPKSRLHGTKVHWNGAEHFPNAYKYQSKAMSTHWSAENINGKWYVTDIWRGICPNRVTRRGEIKFSDNAKEWILNNASEL